MPLPPFTSAILSSIEEWLERLIPQIKGRHALLIEAARYTLFSPSKRLRPLFLLTLLTDYAVSLEKGLSSAAAIECIHTYSLIHDDLPCMDDDHLRRGKKSLHIVYGDAHALLAGDYLLTRAFGVIAQAKELSPEVRINIIEILSAYAGSEGMIGGQVIDLIFEKMAISPEDLMRMHSWKTGALFAASCEIAGIIAEVSPIECAHLKKCGEAFGTAFQIYDDILDITADESTLGKPPKSDLSKHKATFPSHYGLEKSHRLAENLFESAFDHLSQLNIVPSHFKELIEALQATLTLNLG